MSFIDLFPYQRDGAEWLASKTHALLADDMGLGKTAQCIRAADLVQANRVLVICPAAARVNWQREFSMFSDRLRPKVLLSGKDAFAPDESLIISYDLASKARNLGSFDLIIADESHFIKALTTRRTKAILSSEGLIHKTRRFWAVSGTPAPNNISEMWPLLYTFGATSLNFDAFVSRYCTSYRWNYGPVITGTRAEMLPEIRNLLSTIMLRRKKEEVMKDLPPIFYQHQVVESGPVAIDEDLYFVNYCVPKDRREELNELLESQRKFVEMAINNRGYTSGNDGKSDYLKILESIAGNVASLRRYTGLQKVKAIADIIESELIAGAYEKVVIFAIHQGVIEALRSRLAKFGVVTLYGKTPPEKRVSNIDSFQNSKKTRVFIGNIAAAGTAITLTSAHNIVFAESEWVPSMMAQAAMRCHRIGQTKPVTVRFFSLSNSIDEKISEKLKRKTRDLTEIFDAN